MSNKPTVKAKEVKSTKQADIKIAVPSQRPEIKIAKRFQDLPVEIEGYVKAEAHDDIASFIKTEGKSTLIKALHLFIDNKKQENERNKIRNSFRTPLQKANPQLYKKWLTIFGDKYIDDFSCFFGNDDDMIAFNKYFDFLHFINESSGYGLLDSLKKHINDFINKAGQEKQCIPFKNFLRNQFLSFLDKVSSTAQARFAEKVSDQKTAVVNKEKAIQMQLLEKARENPKVRQVYVSYWKDQFKRELDTLKNTEQQLSTQLEATRERILKHNTDKQELLRSIEEYNQKLNDSKHCEAEAIAQTSRNLASSKDGHLGSITLPVITVAKIQSDYRAKIAECQQKINICDQNIETSEQEKAAITKEIESLPHMYNSIQAKHNEGHHSETFMQEVPLHDLLQIFKRLDETLSAAEVSLLLSALQSQHLSKKPSNPSAPQKPMMNSLSKKEEPEGKGIVRQEKKRDTIKISPATQIQALPTEITNHVKVNTHEQVASLMENHGNILINELRKFLSLKIANTGVSSFSETRLEKHTHPVLYELAQSAGCVGDIFSIDDTPPFVNEKNDQLACQKYLEFLNALKTWDNLDQLNTLRKSIEDFIGASNKVKQNSLFTDFLKDKFLPKLIASLSEISKTIQAKTSEQNSVIAAIESEKNVIQPHLFQTFKTHENPKLRLIYARFEKEQLAREIRTLGEQIKKAEEELKGVQNKISTKRAGKEAFGADRQKKIDELWRNANNQKHLDTVAYNEKADADAADAAYYGYVVHPTYVSAEMIKNRYLGEIEEYRQEYAKYVHELEQELPAKEKALQEKIASLRPKLNSTKTEYDKPSEGCPTEELMKKVDLCDPSQAFKNLDENLSRPEINSLLDKLRLQYLTKFLPAAQQSFIPFIAKIPETGMDLSKANLTTESDAVTVPSVTGDPIPMAAPSSIKKQDQDDAKSEIKTSAEATPVELRTPADHSCLFWSVALGVLIPVLNDETAYREAFNQLFVTQGDEGDAVLFATYGPDLKERILAFAATNDTSLIEKQSDDDPLYRLINHYFRQKVANHIAVDLETYTDAVLGQTNQEYVAMLRSPDFWGGHIEINAIFRLLGENYQFMVENARGSNFVAEGKPVINLVYTNAELGNSGPQNHYNVYMPLPAPVVAPIKDPDPEPDNSFRLPQTNSTAQPHLVSTGSASLSSSTVSNTSSSADNTNPLPAQTVVVDPLQSASSLSSITSAEGEQPQPHAEDLAEPGSEEALEPGFVPVVPTQMEDQSKTQQRAEGKRETKSIATEDAENSPVLSNTVSNTSSSSAASIGQSPVRQVPEGSFQSAFNLFSTTPADREKIRGDNDPARSVSSSSQPSKEQEKERTASQVVTL